MARPLSAAIVAVAVSMFLITGPFDVIGAMIAVTLLFVIGGYVWGHSRTAFQSLAVAALLGVIAIPIVGFILELLFAHDRWSLLVQSEPMNCQSAYLKNGGTLEKAAQMANHASTRTAQLYDRHAEEVTRCVAALNGFVVCYRGVRAKAESW